jgi:GNAT superfamily N-acetyltransferase
MQDVVIETDVAVSAKEVVKLRTDSGWEGNLEEWERCLKQNLVTVSARDHQGALIGVGFISGSIRHAQIVDLVVRPDYRKLGVGERILEKLIAYAKTKKIKYLGLTYDKKSAWLKEFYTEHGFQSIDFAMWHKDSLPK